MLFEVNEIPFWSELLLKNKLTHNSVKGVIGDVHRLVYPFIFFQVSDCGPPARIRM